MPGLKKRKTTFNIINLFRGQGFMPGLKKRKTTVNIINLL
jgi:hypothetical protein